MFRRINRHTASLPLRSFVLNPEPPLISHFCGWLQTSTSGRGLFPAPTGTDGDTCGQSNNKPKMPHPVFVPSLPSDLCLNAFQFQFLPPARDWIGGASPRIPIKPASCFLPSVVSHVHAASDQPLHLESVTNTRGSDVRHVNITFNWIYANLFWSTDHSNTGHFHPFLHTSYTDDRDIRVSSQYKILLILWTEIQYLPISQMLIMMWFWFQSNSGACDRYETLSSVRLTQPVTEGRCSSFFFCFLAKKKTTTHYRFKSPSLLTEHHGWISVRPFFSASHWWNRAADAVAVTAAS